MRIFQVIIFSSLLMIILASGCSGLPMRLKSSSEKAMVFLNAEMSTAIESQNHIQPILTDQLQLSETQWCLTYELGPQFSFSTLWERIDQDWLQKEMRPYVENCDWAR